MDTEEQPREQQRDAHGKCTDTHTHILQRKEPEDASPLGIKLPKLYSSPHESSSFQKKS